MCDRVFAASIDAAGSWTQTQSPNTRPLTNAQATRTAASKERRLRVRQIAKGILAARPDLKERRPEVPRMIRDDIRDNDPRYEKMFSDDERQYKHSLDERAEDQIYKDIGPLFPSLRMRTLRKARRRHN